MATHADSSDEPFVTLMKSSASQINTKVAKHLFQLFCSTEVATRTDKFREMSTRRAALTEFRDGPQFASLSLAKRASVAETIHDAADKWTAVTQTCATLTAMVALWRALGGQENRSSVCAEARKSITSLGGAASEELDSLLAAGANGLPTYRRGDTDT